MQGLRLRRLAIAVLASSVLSVLGAPALGQDTRSDYLVRLLRTSEAFRVRAQAALSLRSVPSSPAVQEALCQALTRDDDATVRAAAAASLGELGDAAALPCLRQGLRDGEAPVREAVQRSITRLESQPRTDAGGGRSGGGSAAAGGGSSGAAGGGAGGAARYYVGVGMPGTKVATIPRSVLSSARTFIEGRVQQIDGVVVAPDGESSGEAQRQLRQRSLTGFYLDSSIVSLETRADGGVRAQVSVIVQTYPGRDVRSMLSGAATVMGESGDAAQRAAIEAALGSALRNLGTAMCAGAH